jgi:hypothetical protein
MMAGLTDHQFDTDLYRMEIAVDRSVSFNKPLTTAKTKGAPCNSADAIVIPIPRLRFKAQQQEIHISIVLPEP